MPKPKHIAKAISLLACTVLLGGVVGLHAQTAPTTVQDLQATLLSVAATDFATHGPLPAQVKQVQLRVTVKGSGEKLHLLCGQFLPQSGQGAVTWARFATVQTSPYEQLLGGSAEGLCAQAQPKPGGDPDLSAALMQRIKAAATSPAR